MPFRQIEHQPAAIRRPQLRVCVEQFDAMDRPVRREIDSDLVAEADRFNLGASVASRSLR